MNRRTRILAGVFGGAIVLTGLANFVYPRWIEPLVTLDQRLVQRRAELKKLQEDQAKVDQAREDYKTIVARVGSFDIDRVSTDVRDRLNALIEKRGLRADSVSPSRASKDRKTDVESMTINLKAVGTLESVIGFLQDVSELPQFSQMGNVAIYPVTSSRETRGATRMNLRVPIDLMVLPQNKFVGAIKVEEMQRPETVVRHLGRDYGKIWSGEPFDVYVPPVPLQVNITPVQPVKPNQRLSLQGHASGGDGEYAFQWSPSEGLKMPTSNHTDVDTATPGSRNYTLTVTDGKGNSVSANVTVTVNEPVVATRVEKPAPTPPPPPPPTDPRWKERNQLQLVMTLGRTTGDGRLDELMVYNRRSKETSYYAPGQEFDGGTLAHVHQTGGLVRRKDDPRGAKGAESYWIYPIGLPLDQDLALDAAGAFPELLRAAEADKSRSMTTPPLTKAAASPAESATEPMVLKDAQVDESAAVAGPQPADEVPATPPQTAEANRPEPQRQPDEAAPAPNEGTRTPPRRPIRDRNNPRRVVPPR